MSRGPGRIQQQLLAILDRQTGMVDPFDLAAKVYKVRRRKGVYLLTDAQLVAVRRALRGLEKIGKVYRVIRRKRTMWANERTGLWVTIRQWREDNLRLITEMSERGESTKQITVWMKNRSSEMSAMMKKACHRAWR